MEIPKEFSEMIAKDIATIDKLSGSESNQELMKLHRKLDSRYQACVKDWYKGIWGTDKDASNIFYSSIEDYRDELLDNLYSFKGKLETFQFQMNVAQNSNSPSTQVNVTTQVNVSVSFEQARSQIEGMTSLTEEQTKEILKKVSEIENLVKDNTNKKTKWEKAKPILAWLADKSFDVGMVLLPLLLKINS